MAELTGIKQHFPEINGFCHPEWMAVGSVIERKLPESEWYSAWEGAARVWLSKLADRLGDGSKIHATKNFLILSSASDRVMKDARLFYERALQLILKYLPGVAEDEGFGPHVVLMFAEADDYYRYISPYYPDGTPTTMSSGIHLQGRGYSHFAFPTMTLAEYRTVLVHELTHGCLDHLPIPLWINEALAMRMEHEICDLPSFWIDHEIVDRHERFWNAETIQQFWSGESFGIGGDSHELSYHLAQLFWRKIEEDLYAPREAVMEFASTAHFEDAGEAAFQQVFELSLGELAADFLGDGEWCPDPEIIANYFRQMKEEQTAAEESAAQEVA